jgi:hypothetical protein
MKEKIKHTLSDVNIKRMCFLFLFILVVFGAIGIWKWNALPPQIPLFYSLPRGEEQMGNAYQLLILPLLCVIFFIINFILAIFFYDVKKLVSILFMIIGTIAGFLLLITYLKIIFLVS